jgi:hypothetical protein
MNEPHKNTRLAQNHSFDETEDCMVSLRSEITVPEILLLFS